MRMLLCIGEASAARAMRCLSGYSTHRREKGAQEAAHEVWNPFHPSVSSSLLFLNLFPLVSPSSICLNDTNILESPPKYNCSLMCQPRRDQRETAARDLVPFLVVFWHFLKRGKLLSITMRSQKCVPSAGSGAWDWGWDRNCQPWRLGEAFASIKTQKNTEEVTSGARFSAYLKQDHQDSSANGKTKVMGPYKTCWRSSELSLLLQNPCHGVFGVPLSQPALSQHSHPQPFLHTLHTLGRPQCRVTG